MKMIGFIDLYKDMQRQRKKHEQFAFEYNKVSFDVIFRINCTPYELLIGAIGYSFAMVLQMQRGFVIDNIPDKEYRELCKILKLNYNKNHFSSAVFLNIISERAPKSCSKTAVQPHQIAKYKAKDLSDDDDKEKIYFIGWLSHDSDNRQAQNIEKTRLYLGEDVAEYCRKHNISSRWSKYEHDRKNYYEPWE